MRIEVPDVAAIQAIRPEGSPGPDTLKFASAAVEVDLADLGPLAGRHEPVEGRRAREMFARRWAAADAGPARRGWSRAGSPG